MSRKLILTSRDPYNASFCTPEGQVLYKTTSPYKVVGRKATIDKVIPNSCPDPSDMQDRFERIGEIEYHAVVSSSITFGGITQPTSSFFRKGAYGWLGSDRIFTGPDGKEYRTRLTEGLNHGIKLYTAHKPKIRIAKFNQADLIPGLKRHTEAGGGSANLEIYPEGEHIVDCIVVTLCYIEKLRRDRERAAAS